MKISYFVLGGILGTAGLTPLLAQQYSQNAVGYLDLDLARGFNLIGNPFTYGDQTLNTVLPNVPNGSSLMKWDSSAQQFARADVFFTGHGWMDDCLNASTTILSPLEGVFLQLPEPVQITLVGDPTRYVNLPGRSLPGERLPGEGPGWYLLSCPLFYESFQDCFSLPIYCTSVVGPCQLEFTDGDSVLWWDRWQQSYEPSLTYFAGFGWINDDLEVVRPMPDPGEGFFLYGQWPTLPTSRETTSQVLPSRSEPTEPSSF